MQLSFSQEDGVASLAIPVRNSLRFNRFNLNPTFSFVREQNKYISFTNKREWVQFEDAPMTYLASYSGRFSENIGVGVGLFQQNYGVLTSFGGVLNFAYNARLAQENNLTFGLNLGVYKSGINEGNVITNTPDPSLNNIPSNFLLSISPGINYGTQFFDFGVSVNNLVQYNMNSSAFIEDDPRQSVQAHIMYTGYMDSRGFFDESKFSTLVRSEFQKDNTIISGVVMLTVPKGIWAQAGYNTIYGLSGGLGLNITEQIAIEYNFEKAIGDLTTFGPSHEITLAYKFKKKENYYYSGNDEETAFVIPKKSRKVIANANTSAQLKARQAKAEEARLDQEAMAKSKKDEEARRVQEAAAQAKAEEEARIAAEKLKEIELQAKTKEAKEARLAQEAAAQAKADEEARIAEEKLKEIELQAKAKKEEEARLAQEAEAQAKADKEARLAAEAAVEFEVTHKDDLAISMFNITEAAKTSKAKQEQLLAQLSEAVENKNNDLKDLKEENDLSEQGIFQAPKPFKSVAAENQALEALLIDVDNSINERNKNITDLENQYNERLKKVTNSNDGTNQYYKDEIQKLKEEQQRSVQAKASLITRLDAIKIGIEFERKRRIKRAVYDNEEDRYQKDRATLNQIKQSTIVGISQFTEKDFDFGEERILDNIQIVKNVKNEENGYYVVLAIHSDVSKRNDFITKAIATGQADINFFYDVNTSKYYIYYNKFNSIDEARRAMKSSETKPYNSKMSVVKIEN
jgi:type IX secretion system PorP/SprF family membrane protein